MKIFLRLVLPVVVGCVIAAGRLAAGAEVGCFPARGATGVNADTRLVLTFASEPVLGRTGQIRIYDAADDRLVDVLDLAIPSGPTEPNRIRAPYTPVPYDYHRTRRPTNADTKPGTPSGVAQPTPDTFQLTIIGGFTDGFHFHPVIVRGRVATIQPHHDLLQWGKTYYVQIDPGVLTLADGSFPGIAGKDGWRFTTKPAPPPAGADRYVVSADGTGDFNTVQGAMDFIPDGSTRRVTVFIRAGTYEEIVYFRNKSHVTLLGEDRERTVICYANNEVFNPRPVNVATNEVAGTFPSRRAAFAADNCTDLQLANLTIRSLNARPAQAEGLLLMGERNVVSEVDIEGSGDALQTNGSAYFSRVKVTGIGDNILGRGPAFFEDCELVTTGGPHLWIRNTEANHGNVFLRCKFRSLGGEAVLARSPVNHGKAYPHCEAVLLECALQGVRPEGWGEIGGDPSGVRFWEYASTNLADGSPVDTSRRHPASRQLTLPGDAELIARYRDPAFVLGGWKPELPRSADREPAGLRPPG